MTDYKEEQRNEMEALESIYPNELKVLYSEPVYIFTIDIHTEAIDDEPENYMVISLKFSYVPTYPDEAPVIEVADSENIEENDMQEMLTFLNNLIEENLGMAMVFTLVSEASEWLNKRLQDNLQQAKEEEELKLKQKEDEERTRFEGIRVTVESFLNWKTKFDLEMAELKKLQSKDEALSRKLTGRELFEKDHSLVESDLQFLQDGEDEVKVDESLFQDLDDIELQDGELST